MPWRTARGIAAGAAVTVLVVLLVVLLPVVVAAVGLSVARNVRRMRAAASRFSCRTCGAVLGAQALRRADEVWAAHMRELRGKYPAVRWRVVRHVHAICPACGARYRWHERDGAFVPCRRDC